jgi:hypothetical protein
MKVLLYTVFKELAGALFVDSSGDFLENTTGIVRRNTTALRNERRSFPQD